MEQKISKPLINYTLYLVTDRDLMSTATLKQAVEEAIAGGCSLVQLREKTASSLEFFDTAVAIKQITDRYTIPLIINDRVDIALAVDAAGVHIGQSDIPAAVIRKIIGPHKILGVSASALNEALQAEQEGANYLGIGAMFATGTKTNAKLVTMEQLKEIKAAVNIPVVVIGGINETTIPLFDGTGIDGIAVVSALISKKDITSAAKNLKKLFLQTKGK
ncbi:MAG TPA: thiamine phosphate synthase [Firmicutes bacterium]|jgi:thiamine-phosphate pyrophosphorylase|nr:thiamine phosphate synthase [Bacillota bacterium]